MKKTLSFLLAFLMIVTMVPVVAITSFASTDPTPINTWEGLTTMTAGGTYELTANIAPNETEKEAFTAPITLKNITLNGNGYTVSGFAGANSLFTMDTAAGNTVTISNLVVGANTEAYTGVAVLLDKVPAGTSCTIDRVTVNAKSLTHADTVGVGAVIGVCESGNLVITNCVNNAEVKATGQHFTGGIIGQVAANANAEVDYGIRFENCVNNGVITGVGEVGGIIGGFKADGTSVGNVKILNCENNAEVSDKGQTSAWKTVGGLTGNWNSTDTLEIDGFVNRGYVYGTGYTAGLIGSFADIANHGQTISIKNVSNFGTVETQGTSIGAGLVTSWVWFALNIPVEIDTVVNYGTITHTNATAKEVGVVAGQWKSNSTLDANNIINHGTVKAATNAAVGFGISVSGTNITFTNVLNRGTVESSANECAVGIGNLTGTTNITFTNVLNMGTVKTAGNCAVGIGFSGGTGNMSFTNILNTGVVDGSSKRGALVIANAEHVAVDLSITNAVNIGTIKSAWSTTPILGIVTKLTKLTVTNAFHAGSFNKDITSIADASKLAEGVATYTNVGYVEEGDASAISLEAAFEKITAIRALGRFEWADAEKTAIVQPTPVSKGIQFSNVSEGFYSARLVAVIRDTEDYANIGFEVTVSGKNPKIHYSEYVYETIYGNDNGLITYTAESLGGKYVYGLVINNIPANEAVTITVRTYAKDEAVDGVVEAVEYFGAAQTFTIQNGALVENAQ